jgi:hypothetical protein
MGSAHRMPTQDNDMPGVWRDDERLPLSELVPAVATSPGDGQSDDLAGNDAGIEQARTEPDTASTDPSDPADAASSVDRGDPDPDSAAGRSWRTDFTGPTGPN